MERSAPAEAPGWPDRPAGRHEPRGGATGIPSGPTRREALGFGLLLVLILIVLLRLEAGSGGTSGVALLASGIFVYALLCLFRLEAAFALILVVTPFSFERFFRGSGSALQVPTEPMLFVALAVWGFRFLSRRSTTFQEPPLVGVLLVALAACAFSIVDTGYPVNAVKATVNALWYALFGIFILNNFADRRRLKGVAAAWLVPGMLICLYSMINVATGNFDVRVGYWNAWPFFTEHGTFAAYLSFVCVLALALAIEADGAAKFGFAVLAFLSGAQIVLSLTRGAWMGMAAAIVFLGIVSGRRLLRPGNVLLGAVGVAALVVVIGLSGATRGVEKQTQNITDPSYVSNLERLNRWYAGWNMFRNNPLNGVGYGTYTDNYLNYRRVPLATDQSHGHMGVHSEYLRVLAETGLVGLLAALLGFIVLVVIARRAILRTEDRFLRALAAGMAAGLATYMIHGLVNNFMAYDKVAIPVWTAIGVLGAIDVLHSKPAA